MGYKSFVTSRELAWFCDDILQTRQFRDYPGARNGLQVSHSRPVQKIGWAVDADLESIRKAGKHKVDFLIVHHGIFWGNSVVDRKIRARRIREAKKWGVAIYSSHLPLDAHPELGNSTGLVRALGLTHFCRKPFGKALGREIGWKVEGGKW
ncbi:MAG: Nif3-like dinuclear metal center hexameric protein, partial [Verrucomicrobia bacterium]|nr:Nif3-like dinuclear metal center hexameric protein [Verrucomicrobiota bacterium]